MQLNGNLVAIKIVFLIWFQTLTAIPSCHQIFTLFVMSSLLFSVLWVLADDITTLPVSLREFLKNVGPLQVAENVKKRSAVQLVEEILSTSNQSRI